MEGKCRGPTLSEEKALFHIAESIFNALASVRITISVHVEAIPTYTPSHRHPQK